MSSRVRSPTGSAVSSGSSRNPAKRLLKEMETWRHEQKEEKGIERLGPTSESDLFEWEAVINGKDIGSGYDGRSFPPYSTRYLASYYMGTPFCSTPT